MLYGVSVLGGGLDDGGVGCSLMEFYFGVDRGENDC